MTDNLSPALAKLLAEQYQSPNGDGLGHRYEPDTIVATLRAVAKAVDDGEMDLDYALWSINRWADEIEKGGTP